MISHFSLPAFRHDNEVNHFDGGVHSQEFYGHANSRVPIVTALTHTSQALDTWFKVECIKRDGMVLLNGSDLDIASVIAVAKYNCDAHVAKTDGLVRSMDSSVKMLEDRLAKGCCVYGVNTGFGGSADTRTTDLVALQSALLQLTQAGILTGEDIASASDNTTTHSMPTTWVRASMLIRCNNALRGHSGIRLKLVEAILVFLRRGMTPIVPLRGSISASGDLMPLSYIAGMLEGNPNVHVRVSGGRTCHVVTADKAIQMVGLEPFVLGPNEGLGLINGTAVSTAVGCLVVHESNKLALLAQGLVAMSCEALLGKTESYHPFIAAVCPHPGKIECAANILNFLQGSSLVEASEGTDRFKLGLFQDRYALRGTPQWLGPQLEDLSSILSQLSIELNSTSDNPVIDVGSGGIYSGANFISSSVPNGMEKNRLLLQMIGKLLFGLTSEMINPGLNGGLPPNLAADDPSLSFTMKGIDISMAAYMSELGYLANPVTSHVQSAETHNQSINSLALVSGRYTTQAADIVAHMCAAHLFVACQALDLRVLHITFLRALKLSLGKITAPFESGIGSHARENFRDELMLALTTFWNNSASYDLDDRCKALAKAPLPVLLDHFGKHMLPMEPDAVEKFQHHLQELAHCTFTDIRRDFFHKPTTKSFLGHASQKLYSFVREELGVPFHQGLIEHPTWRPDATLDGRQKRTIGSWISIIYKSIIEDKIWRPLSQAVMEG
ncbi:hypothetical protein NW762_013670 [Fusarium torreyae]|uniref:Phenylalanine ammonia-lyase n=1 Tax=Fusarium torreyae TaxID=1237075 RepID=A0A9W8RNB9_9HYPO|nr:hypothetical protein NW762_013670 [Fusarium torreyae]